MTRTGSARDYLRPSTGGRGRCEIHPLLSSTTARPIPTAQNITEKLSIPSRSLSHVNAGLSVTSEPAGLSLSRTAMGLPRSLSLEERPFNEAMRKVRRRDNADDGKWHANGPQRVRVGDDVDEWDVPQVERIRVDTEDNHRPEVENPGRVRHSTEHQSDRGDLHDRYPDQAVKPRVFTR